ncbi:hypothetical protein CRYUN_Cryun09bG0175500 [Craigia yunnanensis]
MATRNRTLIFRIYRDALKSVRIPASSLGESASSSAVATSSGGGPVIEMVSTSLLHPNRSYTPLSTEDPGNSSKGAITVGLPPAWVDASEEIAANVQCARTKMAELAKAYAKALMPSFGDGKEDQHNIEALTHEITNLLKKSEKRLQKLSATVQLDLLRIQTSGKMFRSKVIFDFSSPYTCVIAEGKIIMSNRSLATDLQNLSMELQKKQSTYLKRLRQQKEGQDVVDLEMNLNGNRSKAEDDDLDDMVFNEHQMAKLKQSEAFTVERERVIEQVVESVNELAQIMKDLSVLVIDQGTIVDWIDYNIQNVATTVEEGLKQLQKAERTQKQGGMVLVIMCFVMLVLLIIKQILFCLQAWFFPDDFHFDLRFWRKRRGREERRLSDQNISHLSIPTEYNYHGDFNDKGCHSVESCALTIQWKIFSQDSEVRVASRMSTSVESLLRFLHQTWLCELNQLMEFCGALELLVRNSRREVGSCG